MKKGLILMIFAMVGPMLMAQAQIKFRSADRAECVKSDYQSLQASFSFSGIESVPVETERGTFSQISMSGTSPSGSIGEPNIPVVNRLIAIPFGATPRVEVKSYSSSDYRLSDYGINTLMPRQPAIRKSQTPQDVPFEYNERAYQTRGLVSTPQVSCEVGGVMRGVRIAQLSVDPVSYDPSSNTIRVFNDIEVEVSFDGADAKATEDRLLKTFSPYFEVVYNQLFNGDALRDIWSEHPDIYNNNVRMMVLTTTEYTQCDAFQQWVTWKRQKGFNVDVHTTSEVGDSSRAIQDFLADEYDAGVLNGNVPTFLVIIGDKNQVVNSDMTKLHNTTASVTDLYYSIADYDIFPDIYTSRMPVKNTTELAHLVEKILEYEQYTMPDPSYLGNALLIAGVDDIFNPRYGQPAIRYAANNYFNTAHGYNNVYTYLTSYSGCYNNLNTGVGFANYTAHGSVYSWQEPELNVSMLNALTNEGKYFWAMGNCCLSGNWGTENGFAQTILSAEHKGAFAYIGSSPETYWDYDFLFTVGSFSGYYPPETPTVAGTGRGAFDAMFMDDMYNTVNAVPFVGNLSVYSVLGSGDESTYCWEQYHTLGDGSVMPYRSIPSANVVNHAETIQPGASSFTVSAESGSMVCLSKNGEKLGWAMVGNSGTVNLSLSSFTAPGPLKLVVTRPQRQPYIADIIVGQAYTISATVDPTGAGTVTGTGNYGTGSEATLVATANPGYEFVNWTLGNEVVSTNASYSFTVSGNAALTAHFNTLQVHHITLASVLNGSIASDVPVAMADDEVTLTATPADGYTFDHWTVFKSDDVSITVPVSNNKFTMPSYDVTVTAAFTMSSSGGTMTVVPPTANSTSKELPTNPYYDYSFTEQIYLSSEIGQAGTITSIGYRNHYSFTATRTIDIYMKQTDKASFSDGYDWVSLTDADKVFSEQVTFKKGSADGVWTDIELTTPFVYDGSSNLLIAMDDNTGNYENELEFFVYEVSEDRCLYFRGDNNESNVNPSSPTSTWGETWNYLNQIRLDIRGSISNEAISVSPSSLEGFESAVGAQVSSAQSFNLLAENLTDDVMVTAPSHFEVCATVNGSYSNSLEFTPTNGRVTATIYVRMKAGLNVGAYEEDIEISSGASVQTVSLSGTVTNSTVYTISASVTPSGSGTVQGAGNYGEGSTATLTAVPNAGYQFVNWTVSNVEVSTDITYSFTVTGNCSVVAHFEVAPSHTITLAAVDHGSISANKTSAKQGEAVTLTATPASGYSFDQWIVFKSDDVNTSVAVSGSSFTMPDYDVTVTAFFLANGDFTNGVTIPESASNTTDVLPSATDVNYSVTEQIYTAAEIAHSGTISTVAFRTYNAFSTTRNIDLYLCHTNKTSFSGVEDWVNLTSNEKVFSGTVTFVAMDWTVITLDTPFEYNGTSNLLVGMDDNTGSEGSTLEFYVKENGYIAALYNNADDDLTMDNPDYDETVTSSNKNQIRFGNINESILATPININSFTATVGNDDSNIESFVVIGRSLQQNITVTAPTHYEICKTENGTYTNSLTFNQVNGTVRGTVYVKLKGNLAVGDYEETVRVGTSLTYTLVALEGTVSNNVLVISDAETLSNLTLNAGNQCVIVSGGILTVTGTLSCTDAANLVIEDGGQLYTRSANVRATFHKSVDASSSDSNGWVGIAAPMDGPTVTNLKSNTFDIYIYDEDNDQEEWQNCADGSGSLLNSRGYLYANSGNTDLVMTGILESGFSVVVPLSYGAVYEDLRGFNLIGNPFPHNLSMSAIKIDGESITEYYIIDGDKIERRTEGEILPGQSFFIRATEENQSVTIYN